jgi:GNAT superfamily N-acetyltransferase
VTIEISTNKDLLDKAMIHRFLSERSYWAEGRAPEVTQRSLDNSLCFGAYLDGRQIGLARVVTDYATFAWVADVFVLEEYRGQGVGKALMQAVIDHPDLGPRCRLMLATRDAHGLYEQYGFELVPDNRFMHRPATQ